jgi:pimeloyl-ACP methyl ester carboxylesterase
VIIDLEENRLHFHRLGHGPTILLAFHGVGQNGAGCFESWENQLGDHYTIFAFDLFFHGQSKGVRGTDYFLPDDAITKNQWYRLILNFLSENQITRFDVVGFSIGGRFALATLEAFPERIDNAFLLAPDGISEHPVYRFATGSRPTRRLFTWVMNNGGWIVKTARFLQKIGVFPPGLVRFTQYMLATPERCQIILRSWISFRQLHFNIPALYEKLQENRVAVYLLIGKLDQVLKISRVKKLSSLLPPSQFIPLDCGHTRTVERAAVWATGLLLPHRVTNQQHRK